METAPPDGGEESWVLLAVARDGETAARWASALEHAGLEADVRIDDAVALTKGSVDVASRKSGRRRTPALRVPGLRPPGEREAAASVLVDQGWDGRFGQTPAGGRSIIGLDVALRGALFAVLSGVVVALLLLWRGG